VIGRSAAPQDREFARTLGVLDHQVRETDLRDLRLDTVPTILLVTSDGRVVHRAARVVTAADVDALLRAAGPHPD
jgi:hypothetical protein